MLSVGLPTFFQRLFHLRRAGSSLESPRYLLKWLLISTAIGLVAGVGALIFFEAIRLSTDFFLGTLVGYLPPDPAGEACGWREQIPIRTFQEWNETRSGFLGNLGSGGSLACRVGILPPILAATVQSLPDLGILANSSRLLRQKLPPGVRVSSVHLSCEVLMQKRSEKTLHQVSLGYNTGGSVLPVFFRKELLSCLRYSHYLLSMEWKSPPSWITRLIC